MLEIPVKLIVKAPNQQIEDQTIHCSLTWTIKRLKGYLSEVYPSKPNTEDQRLIYYGQLLNDSVILKDVFTRYEADEETHTVHLVCMPSKESLKMQARKMAEEKSRKAKEGASGGGVASTSQSQRFPGGRTGGESGGDSVPGPGNSGATQAPAPGPPTSAQYSQPGNYANWATGFQSQALDPNNYMQQWAWMQQFYANYYLNQYMDMIARQYGVSFREGYADARQTEAAHNPEPQVARAVEEEDNRRDWLDYFYILSRLLVLLTILYFYSSPVRFFIVSSLGVALYLYQIGFFRINQIQGLENNEEAGAEAENGVQENNNNNNNAAAAAPPREEISEAAAAPAEELQEQQQQQFPGQQQRVNPEHPSFVALTWTFVTSFFSSIIPETQNAL